MPVNRLNASDRPDALFAALTLADTRRDLVRNIVSLRVSQDLFDDLSPDPADQEIAVRAELAVAPPFYAADRPVIRRPFEEAAWIEAVQFPFEHWAQSRYSRGRYGVWYGADSVETSVAETAYHWRRRLLADAGFDRDGVVVERKAYRVHCEAALIDLRPLTGRFPPLLDPEDYGFCQAVGERLHREGHPGLVTRSARGPGEVYALLTPRVLSDPRLACALTYRIEGGRVRVERANGEAWLWV